MYQYYRTVQYHETDKMGITHHANYIKWMEEARISFLESIGLPFRQIEEEGIVSPVAGLSIEYKSPCTFGDEIVIEATIAGYTGVRLEVRYVMKNHSTDAVVATAASRHCFMKEGRICSLKKENIPFHETLGRATETDCPQS